MDKLSKNKLEQMKWGIRQDFHDYAEAVVCELEPIIWGIALNRLLKEYGEEHKGAIIDILNRPQNPQRRYYGVETGPWYYGIRPSLNWTWAVEEIRPEIEEYLLSGKIPTEVVPVLLIPQVLTNTIADNLTDIEHGLTIFVDRGGRKGIEYKTEAGVGNIDILARNDKGNFVVIEVKSGTGDESALGQLSKYMAWVRRNLVKENNVEGIIVAEKFTYGLKFAASENTQIRLFEYKVPNTHVGTFKLSFERVAT